jgi:hypothetical protein
MLDFLLVLGQVPGTHFYLTFTELFSTYTILLTTYASYCEYKHRVNFYRRMKLNYVMYSTRVRPGRVKLRAVLPDHISLAPLLGIDVESHLNRALELQRSVLLTVEKI